MFATSTSAESSLKIKSHCIRIGYVRSFLPARKKRKENKEPKNIIIQSGGLLKSEISRRMATGRRIPNSARFQSRCVYLRNGNAIRRHSASAIQKELIPVPVVCADSPLFRQIERSRSDKDSAVFRISFPGNFQHRGSPASVRRCRRADARGPRSNCNPLTKTFCSLPHIYMYVRCAFFAVLTPAEEKASEKDTRVNAISTSRRQDRNDYFSRRRFYCKQSIESDNHFYKIYDV